VQLKIRSLRRWLHNSRSLIEGLALAKERRRLNPWCTSSSRPSNRSLHLCRARDLNVLKHAIAGCMDCESHLRDHGRTTVVWRAPQVTLLTLLEENEKGFKQLDVDRIKEDYCAENSSYPCRICSTCSLCLRTCDRQLLKSVSIIRSSCIRYVIAPNVVHNLKERKTTFVDLFLSRKSYGTIQQDTWRRWTFYQGNEGSDVIL